MATFTIVLEHPGGNITFKYTPYLEVSSRVLHRNTEPPTVVGIEETWTLTDLVFLGTPDEIQSDLAELETKLQDRANQVTGLKFKKDGSTVDELSTTTHTKFRIIDFHRQKSGGHYQNHLVMTLTAKGVRGIEDPSGGSNSNVTDLKVTTTYEYSKEGLLRKTYAGQVETINASAVAKARVIGRLELPSTKYTYAHNGPEGLNVVQEDAADRKASWSCTIEEQRIDVPSGQVYTYEVSRSLEHTRYGYLFRTDFNIAASTMDIAVDAATALKPQRATAGGITKNENTNSVRGFWTEFVPKVEGFYIESYQHEVSRSGGGHTITEIQVPSYDPVLLQNAKSAVRLVERIVISYFGTIGASLNKFLKPFINRPANLDGDPTDSVSLVDQGLSQQGNRYTISRTWNWIFSTGIPTWAVMLTSVEQTEPVT